MNANVKREGDKVWVKSVGNYENDESGLSHIRTLAHWLRHQGHDVHFDWLMGVSGEAFCYYYHPDGTALSQMVRGWDFTKVVLNTYGYTGQWREATEKNGEEAVLEALAKLLTEDGAVIAPGVLPQEDAVHSQCARWFIITAVDRRAGTIQLVGDKQGPVTTRLAEGDDRRPLPEGTHPCWYGMTRYVEPGKKESDCLYGPSRPVLVTEKTGKPMSETEVAVAALRRALKLLKEEKAIAAKGWGRGTYLAGLTAMQRIHDDLLAAKGSGVEEFRRLNPAKGDPFFGLWDETENLHLLSKRRESAARYLESISPKLTSAARSHLLAAAKAFRESGEGAHSAFALRYGSIDEWKEAKDLDADPQSKAYWDKADKALADPETRKAMARHVAGMLAKEKAGIAEIENALEALK